ncbi:MAG TPA: hypothetical protein VFN18_00550 [Solirubrobacterales bacterium]|nr:hypothetical protein [Solirubrobacterales bacterium]
MAREEWTDQRLDDLNARVDRIERRMDEGFAEMRAQFTAQNRMLVQIFASQMIGFLGVIAAIITRT